MKGRGKCLFFLDLCVVCRVAIHDRMSTPKLEMFYWYQCNPSMDTKNTHLCLPTIFPDLPRLGCVCESHKLMCLLPLFPSSWARLPAPTGQAFSPSSSLSLSFFLLSFSFSLGRGGEGRKEGRRLDPKLQRMRNKL